MPDSNPSANPSPSDTLKNDLSTKDPGTPKPERTLSERPAPAPSPRFETKATPKNGTNDAPIDVETPAPDTPSSALQSVADRAATPHPSKHDNSPPSAEEKRKHKTMRMGSPSASVSAKDDRVGGDPFVDTKDGEGQQIMESSAETGPASGTPIGEKIDLNALQVHMQSTIDKFLPKKSGQISDITAFQVATRIRVVCVDLHLTQEEAVTAAPELLRMPQPASPIQTSTPPAPVLP
ncbi:uncharacterized protein BDZ99DRAFT_569313 [Mytilinidion resinicola]|uniref:Uncharacterized protein n=1 Tax=Mytilinidion resinicola TaxID=574789 RepID=A0A6A6YWA7_9PEZI|nr:uncharacterized protein BDZ99DRAFT_569313 [Mytilinidion resinicola]KAF2812673.1 hypothetical protein BDZ99DRAFT_569313 [Mytilinidion resinicola]